MDLNKIGLLAFLSPLFLCFQQVRSHLSSVFSFLIKKERLGYRHQFGGDNYRSDEIAKEFISILRHGSWWFNLGNASYVVASAYNLELKKQHFETFRSYNKTIILYKYWFPILVTEQGFYYFNLPWMISSIYKKWSEDYRDSFANLYVFSIRECRGNSVKAKNMLEGGPASTTTSATESHSNASRYSTSYLFWRDLELTPSVNVANSKLLEYAPQDLNGSYFYYSEPFRKLKKDVEFWRDSEQWYVDRSISWRRSALLYGPPGTGKSSNVLNLARDMKMSLTVLDISSMDNEEFCLALSEISPRSLILIEDIDRIFKQEINVTKTDHFGGLTFDCLLNKLSGVSAIKNSYIILTANNLSDISDVMMRDGRVDTMIEVGPIPIEGKRHIASKILDRWPEEIEQLLNDADETAAQFENKCVKLAVAKHWEHKK